LSRWLSSGRLWLTTVVAAGLLCLILLAACLERLGAGLANERQAELLRQSRQLGQQLREDVSHLFAGQMAHWQGDASEGLDEYTAGEAGARQRVERLCEYNPPADGADALRRQLDAWLREIEIVHQRTPPDQGLPQPEDVALLTRQGNQMLLMSVTLSEHWAARASELKAYGRVCRRQAGQLAGACVSSALTVALVGLGWHRLGRSRATQEQTGTKSAE
jgi:hypothetical protein